MYDPHLSILYSYLQLNTFKSTVSHSRISLSLLVHFMTAGQNPSADRRPGRNHYVDKKPSSLCNTNFCNERKADLIAFVPSGSNVILHIDPVQL